MAERAPFLFIADHLALDFVNTELVDEGELRDRLGSFGDLVAWARQAWRLDARAAARIHERWGTSLAGAGALAAARSFRAELRRMAEDIVAGRRVGPATVSSINAVLRRPLEYQQIVPTSGGFERRTRLSLGRPEDLLVPMAQAAAELLVTGDWSRVRACGNPQCVLFFYDTTRSHTRRWCSMQSCGNRMKVAAFFQRQRSSRRKAGAGRRKGT